ncbi:Putative phagocytic receptor 1a Flags:Precursor [Monoraphidium neglectum]|uniref:Transmembrane 9 superfamily member n=1 Tax=Monoraphidium neglectum TaxID=145388 RepID=A0A0D2LSZ8_9CHLO|nr:Putative phagocytic receptor 1a Flags:Precursor [Monoraphidium neglectum]KIY92886.1 Putative phagocytic receptor 1a Flags:Precursor [Monoraphidium neglectum]|eukprot:XP_013891906.1 Putative phagocytic receptor 1a Flags:Precursor [Monoraphidium neglectum]
MYMPVAVNSLTSFETDLPFEYYTLPFCRPPEGIKKVANTANLGTILQGLRIENSPYNLTVMVKELALNACGKDGFAPALSAGQAKALKDKVDKGYRVNMVLDNLPVTTQDLAQDNEFVRPGFDLGFRDGDKYYINNHLRFTVLVHPTNGEYTWRPAGGTGLDRRRLLAGATAGAAAGALGGGAALSAAEGAAGTGTRRLAQSGNTAGAAAEQLYMVVGFEVKVCSIARTAGKTVDNVECGMGGAAEPAPQEIKEKAEVVYTYDVFWQVSETQWASRWDAYLRMPGGKSYGRDQ